MPAMNSLLDKAAASCSPPNDSELARRLGVSRSAVSLWRRGQPPKDEHLAALIAMAQQDPALAVLIRQEQATTKAERALWGPLWDRLSPATTRVVGALALCAIAGLYLTDSSGVSVASLYIMLAALVIAAAVGTELVRQPFPFFGANDAEGSDADRGHRPGAVLA
jgi:transcriptional regulator with XRE-family HTH domain